MARLVFVPQVAGIKGMLIANKREDNQVKTYITYNKGRNWRLLQAPTADLEGNDIHCILVGHAARHTRPTPGVQRMSGHFEDIKCQVLKFSRFFLV